jgi:hypothetical protein
MTTVPASEELERLMVTGKLRDQRAVVIEQLASSPEPEQLADMIIAADDALGDYSGFHVATGDYASFVSRNLRLIVEEISRFARLHRSAMKPDDLIAVQRMIDAQGTIFAAL